jgi:hypothetical protein
MENKNNANLYDLVEKAKISEENRKLIGTIPITGVLKKMDNSKESFIMIGYDVDNICPPWWPKHWPPGPWPPRRDYPYGGPESVPWLQKSIRIDIKDVIKHEIIDKTQKGENIVTIYVDRRSIVAINIIVNLADLVTLNPQPLPPREGSQLETD